jgi:hypothetical protein
MLERYANKFFPNIKSDTIIDEYIRQSPNPSSGLSYEGLHVILSQQPTPTQPTKTPTTNTPTIKSPPVLSDVEMTRNHRTMDQLVEFVKTKFRVDDMTAREQIGIALYTGSGNLPLDPSELTFKRVDSHMNLVKHDQLNRGNRSETELFNYASQEFPTLTDISIWNGINELYKTRSKPEDQTFKNLNIILERLSRESQYIRKTIP